MFSQGTRSHQGSARRSYLRRVLASACAFLSLALVAGLAVAEPATFNVIPTFSAPADGGPVDEYRAFQGCDLAAQTTGPLIAAVTSGVQFSFAGDTTTPPTVCVRAFNSFGLGAFGTAYTLGVPPGSVSSTFTCEITDGVGGAVLAECVPVVAP